MAYAGSERVLEQMLAVYPDADLFCVMDFLDNQQRDFNLGKNQQLPLFSICQKLGPSIDPIFH